jgi:hypothetical protein
MRWLITCLLLVNLLSSCYTSKSYYECVVIEKAQPNSVIQCVIIGIDKCNLHSTSCDSMHFVYPSLTIDEKDSLNIGDTIIISKENYKLLCEDLIKQKTLKKLTY